MDISWPILSGYLREIRFCAEGGEVIYIVYLNYVFYLSIHQSKNTTFFLERQTDRQADIVVYREVKLPKSVENVTKVKLDSQSYTYSYEYVIDQWRKLNYAGAFTREGGFFYEKKENSK